MLPGIQMESIECTALNAGIIMLLPSNEKLLNQIQETPLQIFHAHWRQLQHIVSPLFLGTEASDQANSDRLQCGGTSSCWVSIRVFPWVCTTLYYVNDVYCRLIEKLSA